MAVCSLPKRSEISELFEEVMEEQLEIAVREVAGPCTVKQCGVKHGVKNKKNMGG